jgi:hypothetical protein
MVISDARMETNDAGVRVIQEAHRQPYNPATALLTAYPPLNGEWKQGEVTSLLVKPVGTQDLMRQIEALLVRHEDTKQAPHRGSEFAGESAWNREGGRKVS